MTHSIRYLLPISLAMFLSQNSDAGSDIKVLDGGPQVRAHVIESIKDRNHDEDLPERIGPAAHPERVGQTKTAADGASGLQVPLRRGLSNDNPGIFGIGSFVDHDEAFSDQLRDWNCGPRTYDTENFNHNGTDYNSAQFPWLTMANDGLVVTAAADGRIIERHDGEPDQQCAFDDSAEANLVRLEHADGSVTTYAHMKTGSVTPRKVGDLVEQGDYLGVVGSSGFSTGPHLHLGVQDSAFQLLDPYAGDCNLLNAESKWAEQESYREKHIMDVATHSTFPEYPPCPQLEVPNFKDVFGTEDALFGSVTVRDFEDTDVIDVEILLPSGESLVTADFSDDSEPFVPATTITFGWGFTQPLPEGQYTWKASYAGETMEYPFHVGNGPESPPAPSASNNAFTGLWYDPLLDGEGFNIVTTAGGTIVYFYGSDSKGNRVWLISGLIPGDIEAGKAIEVVMYESSGGVFPTPVSSARGLSAWGTLILLFTDCENGQSTLKGMDGEKVSQIIKLAGVGGASCVEGDVPADSTLSGLWYDPTKDGEGFNLIVAPVGRILYFYGFKANGLRLWLISALISDVLEAGTTVVVTMYEATQGTFSTPVPSEEALIEWGTATITVIDCNTITIELTGLDGSKTSATVRLAGIIGTSCENL